MKTIKYLILVVVVGLSMACGLTTSSEATSASSSVNRPADKQIVDKGPNSPIITPAAGSTPISQISPVATPTSKQIDIFQTSPVATPLAESTTIDGHTETGGRQAIFPNTIIVYQREGKFPGSLQKWTVYHTGRIVAGDGTEWQMPAAQVEPLFVLVENANFWTLDDNYFPDGQCDDCVTQTVTIYAKGEIKEVVVINKPAHTPQNLSIVLDDLDNLTASK